MMERTRRNSIHTSKSVLGILLATMMLFMLAGCGANANGKYVLDKMVMDGKEYTISELSEQYGMDVSSMFQFEIEINGSKATGKIMGENYEGTAKLKGDVITITFENDPLDCKYNASEGTITMDFDGETAILKRQ